MRTVNVLLVPFALIAQTDLGRVVPAGSPVRVVAFGDYGSGLPYQGEVAGAILKRHHQSPFTLGLTLGDNFYNCGVSSVQDQKWEKLWEHFYTPLGIKFYATLGNHDYARPFIGCLFHRAHPDAEIRYSACNECGHSWQMPAKYYTFTAGPVRFFALDTQKWSSDERWWLSDEFGKVESARRHLARGLRPPSDLHFRRAP